MAKKYIYRNTKVFRATYVDENHATNVVRNAVPQEDLYRQSISYFCREWNIDLSDFNKISKAISIYPRLNTSNGTYYLDAFQLDDMNAVVRMFLKSNNSLSTDISRAIKEKVFVEVDDIPNENVEKENDEEVKQTEKNEYNNKRFVDSLRRKNKREIGKKFVVGKKYFLKVRSVTNYKHVYKIYELKKFIYSINNRTVNVVVMKRLNGEEDEHLNTTFTLNRTDCAKYHIKYEKGLQVFPMELNWCPLNENNVKFKEALKDEKQYS